MTKKKKKRYKPKSLGRLIGIEIMRGIITFMVVITYILLLYITLYHSFQSNVCPLTYKIVEVRVRITTYGPINNTWNTSLKVINNMSHAWPARF